jgi:hypothetical protein
MHDHPIPTVAPFESCIACFRGDTPTFFWVDGDAEFHVAALLRLAGLPPDQAEVTILAYCERELGCEPGLVPGGRFQFRLCRECAKKTGARVFHYEGPAPTVEAHTNRLPGIPLVVDGTICRG